MALDFIIKDNKDYPKGYLPIGAELHWYIINEAKKNVLLMFSRIADYYADSFYDISELDTLIDEIDRLMNLVTDKKEAEDFLIELRKMVESAKKQNKGIFVRAD